MGPGAAIHLGLFLTGNEKVGLGLSVGCFSSDCLGSYDLDTEVV